MIKRMQNVLKYLSESFVLNEDFYKGVSVESERLKRNEYVEIFKNPSYINLGEGIMGLWGLFLPEEYS
jgi:predicted metal-dependent TIM-barrel fold hydrolase